MGLTLTGFPVASVSPGSNAPTLYARTFIFIVTFPASRLLTCFIFCSARCSDAVQQENLVDDMKSPLAAGLLAVAPGGQVGGWYYLVSLGD